MAAPLAGTRAGLEAGNCVIAGVQSPIADVSPPSPWLRAIGGLRPARDSFAVRLRPPPGVRPSAGDSAGRCDRPPRGVQADHPAELEDIVELREPEVHAHRAVHRRRGREVLGSLFALARPPVQLAQAEVAVGDERTHAKCFCQRHRLTKSWFRFLEIRAILAQGDLSEETEGPCLVSAFLAFPGESQRALRTRGRINVMPRRAGRNAATDGR